MDSWTTSEAEWNHRNPDSIRPCPERSSLVGSLVRFARVAARRPRPENIFKDFCVSSSLLFSCGEVDAIE